MATWCGSSRALPDHRIASNSRLTFSGDNIGNNITNITNTTTTTTDFNNTTSAAVAAANTAAIVSTNTNTISDTATETSGNGGAAIYDYFTALGNPNTRNLILNGAIPSQYPLGPLLSPPANDSFFATVGDSLPTPIATTPNPASIPLLHIGGTCHGAYHGAPLTTALGPPLLTPPAPPLPPLLPPPTLHPGCIFPYAGGYPFYGHTRNYLPQTPPDIQGNSREPFPFVPSWVPSFATTPATVPQLHMSNVNPRPAASIPQAQCSPRAVAAAQSIDDPYLNSLATQNFSSPSLPPLSNLPSPIVLSPFGRSAWTTASRDMPPSSTRRRIPNRGAVDLTKREPDLETTNSGVDPSIPLATMPPATRRRSIASGTDSGVRKRRPSAATSPTSRPSKARRKDSICRRNDQSSPFDDDDLQNLGGGGDLETIDLSNATEVPAEILAPKVDNRVKIGNFQCVICMDDTTALTVTHCGHLFCSECLHSSLHIDTMKRACPVCRSKVELKGAKKPTKTYYHLELKVMTKTKQGKRPADT
ncbi:hypothetical protein F5B22DRAFT_583313 [Xylaria bambusicola]|uniref:uncharacterized protein n=1 Tax=Xylaria bambusicola TaxID=326684 RepID=UPI00200875C8|nr:uncharacterized protein F5B22DRAFT_583313 [Xylaria bambusicola]KAI0528023.1 hypothetical protein F5B22DRAFT_583313 [Xylaria bambusicola]